MKRYLQRSLAALLTVLMLVSLLPAAFAEDVRSAGSIAASPETEGPAESVDKPVENDGAIVAGEDPGAEEPDEETAQGTIAPAETEGTIAPGEPGSEISSTSEKGTWEETYTSETADTYFPADDAETASFSSLEELEQLCATTYSKETVAFFAKESGDLVISSDLAIPENLTVVVGAKSSGTSLFSVSTWDAGVTIPGGITVTVEGVLCSGRITVDGKMILSYGACVSNYLSQDLVLTVNGSIENNGTISAEEIYGLQYIEQDDVRQSYIYIYQACDTMNELINLLHENDNNRRINLKYTISFSGTADFTENTTIPSNTELQLRADATVYAGVRLTVLGELEVNSYSADATLLVEGTLKNNGRVYVYKYDRANNRICLQSGGSYIGTGSILIYPNTAAAADMLPGFDLAEFTSKINGSFTQLKLTNYEEPGTDNTISSFEEFKDTAENGSNNDIFSYTGPNPLVIEEDLNLGYAQDVHFYPTDIVVPEGVTFTVHGFFTCRSLTVHGTMNVYSSINVRSPAPVDEATEDLSYVKVDGTLNLYSTLATTQIEGEENIRLLGEDSRIYIIRKADSEAEIRDMFYRAQSDVKDWKEYCASIYADLTLQSDLAIPRNCSLDIYDGTFTVPEGYTLTVNGASEFYGGRMNVLGTLENNGAIRSYFATEQRILLRDDVCYTGDGVIYLSYSDVSAQLSGFDLDNCYVVYGGSGSWTMLTRSEAVYQDLEAGVEVEPESLLKVTANIQYHQTEGRQTLEYVNDFRLGDEAYYQLSSGGTESVVGMLDALTYSYSLEEIAMQRAAEIAVQFFCDHRRPNGEMFNTLMSSDGKYSEGENLALSNKPSAYKLFVSLREDNEDYSGQGHRRNMLSRSWQYYGAGYVEYSGYAFLVQEFGRATGTGTACPAEDAVVLTVIDVTTGNVSGYYNVSVEPQGISLAPGETAAQPSVSADVLLADSAMLMTDSPSATVTPAWTVADASVVEISDGVLVALEPGETTLQARCFDKDLSVPVVVSLNGISAPAIVRQPAALTIGLGAEATFTVEAEGGALSYQWYYRVKEGADWKKITTTSGQTDTLRIKAYGSYNSCDFRCLVTNPVGSVYTQPARLTLTAALNQSTLTLSIGETAQLRFLQSDGSVASAVWRSSNSSVASVNYNGVVTAKKGGTAVITATVGSITLTCNVKVPHTLTLSVTELTLAVGKSRTLSVTDGDGKTVSADWSTSDAAVASVNGRGTVTAKKVGKAVITAMVNGAPLTCDVRVLFKDVTDSSLFYYEAIYNMVDRGVIGGFDDGTFRPTGNCNRAAVVTFLWRLAGKPEPAAMATFSDMTDNPEFDKAISWAAENEITTGYDGNLFKPWATCNRAAIVTFLWRYAGKPEPSSMATFKDMTDNADFNNAISWAAEKGITTGWASDNTFRPWNMCNRLAVASFLDRYDKLP